MTMKQSRRSKYDSSRVGELLRERGQMQSWLARRLGISTPLLCRIIGNERTPSPEIRQRIADILNQPEDKLFVAVDVRGGTAEQEQDDCANDEAVA